MTEEQRETLYCPYCGEPTVMTPSSSVPYCNRCQRYIYAASGDGPLSPYARREPRPLSGIGGWLLFPAIAAIVFPVVFLAIITSSFSAQGQYGWLFIEYPHLWTMTQIEVGGSLALLLLSLVVTFTFFTRRRIAPRLYIALLGAFVLLRLILLLASIPLWDPITGLATDMIADTVVAAAAGGLWGAYFVRSERVRTTFVR